MKKFLLLLAATVPALAPADEVHVVARVEAVSGSNAHYPTNKTPLTPSPLVELPIGSIAPHGWLRHQLDLEANGMGGRLAEVSQFLKFEDNGWVTPTGKGGWEELPYFLKGFGDLGYVTGDERILKDARRWIDGILNLQDADGWFGPQPLRTAINGHPDMWPHMPILNALQSWYDFSGDQRVIPFMTKYFQWQNTLPGNYFSKSWQDVRFGDNIESIYWLYNRTGDTWLLDLVRKMHENSARWARDVINWHNVNFAQGFREPAEVWQQLKDPDLLQAAERNYEKAMFIYGQFPGGGFAADENARPGYTGPRQGFETCGIVEFMHSFEMLGKITGDPLWADDIDNHGTMFSYSPNAVYRCCQHNHVMGWPYYAEHLWLATADNGLCATLYAAGDVTAIVGNGEGGKVIIAETTNYPFSDTIQLRFTAPKAVEFPLYLRIPRWCSTPTIQVNGKDLPIPDVRPQSMVVLNRKWSDGDTVLLNLPMEIKVKTWEKNDNAVSVDYGPLSFSLTIGERYSRYGGSDQWPELEVYPTTPWNYGLLLDPKDPSSSFKVVLEGEAGTDQPFTAKTAPVHLEVKARQIPGWQMDRLGVVGKLESSPIRSNEPDQIVTLIPMGAARLRISTFPTIGDGPEAHEWPMPKQPEFEASASHVFDTLEALNDGILPKTSSDKKIPRFTWWDHRGTVEWVQYTLKKPRTVSSTEVYWFDDTGVGACRVPKSWRLLYQDGNEWKPVPNASAYGTQTDRFNTVKFTPVTTPALRLEVQLQAGFSGGILEWSVHD
jgi:hypothetical protein